jgi:hypothetical protein
MVEIVACGLFLCGGLYALWYGARLAHEGKQAYIRAQEMRDQTTELLQRHLDYQMGEIHALIAQHLQAIEDDDDDDFAAILRMSRRN